MLDGKANYKEEVDQKEVLVVVAKELKTNSVECKDAGKDVDKNLLQISFNTRQ